MAPPAEAPPLPAWVKWSVVLVLALVVGFVATHLAGRGLGGHA